MIIGHFATLADAQLMVQETLEAGLIQETFEEGQLASFFPVTQIKGVDHKYNRKGTPQDGAFFDIHEQIPWSTGAAPTQVTVGLKRIIRQEILDADVIETYDDPNNYEAEMLMELREGVMRTAEDKWIYGNLTTNSKEYNGLHALVASGMTINEGTTSTGAALNVSNMRKLVDLVRPRPDTLLVNRDYSRRFDEAYEMGMAGGSDNFRMLGMDIIINRNEVGLPSTFFRGVPFMRSDFLTITETIASSTFSLKTGGATTSIFAIRRGSIAQGGVGMVVGTGSGGGPSLFQSRKIMDLEDYDGDGIRLRARTAMYLGSTKALGRIDGITDVPITK